MHLTVLLRAGAIATALSVLALSTLPARAETEPPAATLSLQGSAEIAARPDRAVVTTGVVSEAETARAALDENSAALARVIATLKDAGIEDRDIATSGFSVQPRYHYPQRNDRSEPPRIVGYQVSNQVTVRIRDLDLLGPVLDQVVTEGANQIHGIAFEVSDADRRLDEARADAVADARRKAEIYAEAAGVRLLRVRAISESVRGDQPPQPMMMRSMAMDMAEAVPVEAGTQMLRVRVDITWEIGE